MSIVLIFQMQRLRPGGFKEPSQSTQRVRGAGSRVAPGPRRPSPGGLAHVCISAGNWPASPDAGALRVRTPRAESVRLRVGYVQVWGTGCLGFREPSRGSPHAYI